MKQSVEIKIGSKSYLLTSHGTGQWRRDFWDSRTKKSVAYYFGGVLGDPTGDRAAGEFLERLPGILAGTDRSTIQVSLTVPTALAVVRDFLSQRRVDQKAGTLASETLRDYIRELDKFLSFLHDHHLSEARITALKPEHFAAYANHLVSSRKLSPHAQKRVQAYVRACFNWGAGNGKYPAIQYGTAFEAPSTTPEAIRQFKSRRGIHDNSKRVLTGAEIDAIVAVASPAFQALTLLSVNCGLGPKDLGRLTWGNLNFDTGRLDMPRSKTGNERVGYLWQRTRVALLELRGGRDDAALVFVTPKGKPFYYVEEVVKDGVLDGFRVNQIVSGTFTKLAKLAKVAGVNQYRCRHTFKTLGKAARDKDALNLMMGHREGGSGATYDHEDISLRRIRRVALKVKGRLWPKLKRVGGQKDAPTMRLVGTDAA